MEQEELNLTKAADGAPRPRRVTVGTPGMFRPASEAAAPCTCLTAPWKLAASRCGCAVRVAMPSQPSGGAAPTSGNDDEGPTASAAAAVTAAYVAAASMCFTYAVVGALRRHVIMHR